MLNLERDEFTPMNPVVRARMTIHSPDIVPNPQYDGVSLQPGRTYNYGVRKVFHISQEEHYDEKIACLSVQIFLSLLFMLCNDINS